MIKTLLKVFFALYFLNVGLNAKANKLMRCDTLAADTIPQRVAADGRPFPTPPDNPHRLFYLQRTPNINALCYDVNIDKKTGQADEDSPIHVYWLQYAKHNGEPEELNFIQRRFAYGYSSKALGNGKYDIRLVSYKKIPFTLMKGADGKYHIFATIAKKHLQLKSIFIQINGGSMWSPNVIFVEMKGTDPANGKEVTERFKP
ncbi:DUF4833 domain-containing protein [Mucilaginibacter achroorhodeus]|uniref:DUF4833 domain-containing protein n=1 Tax=Mucilaginibacter achroorhodeus TaxID=2599294 RepID=A0A563U6J1_9SPHI|nr:DUF4833 domain-containing protein [Mucilaginibacter achroorhodeus]TWR26943.1 DUF4833 domain-containing protein [Mucilaginibacter achroorhodeus]